MAESLSSRVSSLRAVRAMDETAAEVVLREPSLLARILHSLVAVEDAPTRAELCACACVSRAFAAAAASDTLWRAALLRRWPGTLACMMPAVLPTGVRLRDLYKRRHVADAAATAVAPRAQRAHPSLGAAAVPLEHRHRFELKLFKPNTGGGHGGVMVFSATFMMRITPEQPRWHWPLGWPTAADSDTADDCNRITTAGRAFCAASGCYRYEQYKACGATAFDVDLTTHASHPLASVTELRSLRSSLTVFRRCPAMNGDGLNDFAVLYAHAPVALLEGITPPPPIPAGGDPDFTLRMLHWDWDHTSHTLDEGVTRVMAAGELPLPDAGYWMSGDDGYDSDGGGGYHMTMQVCLDLLEEEEGSGMAFPAAQPRARLVFTVHVAIVAELGLCATAQPRSRGGYPGAARRLELGARCGRSGRSSGVE